MLDSTPEQLRYQSRECIQDATLSSSIPERTPGLLNAGLHAQHADYVLSPLERINLALAQGPRSPAFALVILALAALYFFAGQVGHLFAMAGEQATAVWAPSGIALAALLLLGRRVWPGVWLGAFAIDLLGLLDHGGGARPGLAMMAAGGMATGATVSAWLGHAWVMRGSGCDQPLDRLRGIGALLGLGGVITSTISATNGALWLTAGGLAPWNAFGEIWLTWWLGDAAGVFVFTPLLLAWCGRPAFRPHPHWLEAGICCVLLLAFGWSVFIDEALFGFSGKPFHFMLVPFLVWPALRFGHRGATAAILFIATVAVWGASHGWGPFHLDSLNASLLVLEAFLSMVTLTALTLAAVATEHHKADSRHRQVLAELESRVQQRTTDLQVVNQQLQAEMQAGARSQAALAESEMRLRAIIQTEPECVKLISREGKLLEMNPAGLAMLDATSLAEVQAQPLLSFIVAEYRKAFSDLHQKVLDGGSGTLEFEVISLTGRRRWLECHDVPLRDTHGRVNAILSVTRDITERKQMEASLRLTQFSIDRAVDAVFWIAPDAEILYANAAACRTLGYVREEIVGQKLSIISPNLTPEAWESRWQEVKQSGVFFFESECRTKDQRLINIEVTINYLEFEGRECQCAIMRDITGRKLEETRRQSLEAQLRQAQKMEAIGTLAGGIAHDFNNILTAILGNAQLAAMDAGPDHPAMQSLQEIRKASMRARELVGKILAFSRQSPSRKQVLDLHMATAEVVQLLRATLPASVELTVHRAAAVPAVLADPTEFHQVLMNLCTNAWQAMADQVGRIALRLDSVLVEAESTCTHADLQPGRYAQITVSDTGKGMDAATLERIFDPFFTTKEVGTGSGLGLSIVHGIVKNHQGAIRVISQPGEGTTVELHLPTASQEQFADMNAPRPAALLQGQGQHVLVLDDEEPLVILMTRLLQRQGYRVTGLNHSADALTALEDATNKFDLLVTDYNMPGASGIEVARISRTLHPDLPVLLITGYMSDHLKIQANAAGIQHFLDKPHTVEQLCEKVHALMQSFKQS
ncbi:MAG: MASE1 domain-containing protein [Steroidobacteraceae bacterium]